MDDRIRISDADRDRVTTRLRDHFAEGRLTTDEFDERITATLNAKTFGDLRHVMADLPEPVPAAARPQQSPGRPAPRRAFRHRPPLLPLVLLALIAALVLPGGGWLFFAFVKVVLVFWLVALLAGILLAGWIRRRVRRDWWSGWSGPGSPGRGWSGRGWPGSGQHRHPYWQGDHFHHGRCYRR
jgi:Domain of unknown function (DUF1707)